MAIYWSIATTTGSRTSSGSRLRFSATASPPGVRTLHIAYQSIVEFVAATTRAGPENRLLDAASREAEEFMAQFPILYPDAAVLRTALRGAAAYGLSWFDAHLWAYAEIHGIPELLSEDFQHGLMYGTVLIRYPFLPVSPAT